MTIKEFYEMAVKDGTENYDIELRYQDNRRCYYGYCQYTEHEYKHERKQIILA